MKRVIKNKKKMKNTMYIVFGVFALLLFMITRTNPSFANEGLIIDEALDKVAEQTIPSDNVSGEDSEVSDESIEGEDPTEPEIVPEEKVAEGDENSQDLENDEDDNGGSEENLDGEEVNNGENDENEDGNDEGKNEESEKTSETEEVDNQTEVETPSEGESYGASDNEESEEIISENEQDVNKSNNNEYEGSETGSFIANLDAEIQNIIEIESEEIRGEEVYEGVKVEVYAQTGAFPKGTILSIIPITGDDEISDIQDVLEEQKNVEKTEKLIAFDITFLDPETQEELQPLTGTVQVTFNYEENEELKVAEESEDQEVKVYHLNDKDEEGEKVEEIKDVVVEEVVVNEEKSEEENVMVVEAESFSVYTITIQLVTSATSYTIYNQISNWIANDLDLYFLSGDGVIKHTTILDRNLGATEIYSQVFGEEAAAENQKAFGYHYQWGNNYGFKLPTVRAGGSYNYNGSYDSSTVPYEVWSNYVPSKYARSKFSTSGNWMEGATTGDNIWGGFGDDLNKNGDGTSLFNLNNRNWSILSGRQGPCPEGYYVPSIYDWKMLLETWKISTSTLMGYQLSHDLLLPNITSIRNSRMLGYGRGEKADYSSSSAYNTNANYAYYFTYSQDGFYSLSHNRSVASVLRCFKVITNQDISIYANGGTNAVIAIDGNNISALGEPKRANSHFDGRYTTSNYQEGTKVSKGDTLSSNSLYAKWTCNLGYRKNQEDTLCELDTNKFTVYFHPNGGNFSGLHDDELKEIVYNYNGNKFLVSENLQAPNKTGYMFVGWFTTQENQVEEFDLRTPSKYIAYAKWLPFNDLTLVMSGISVTLMDRNMGAKAYLNEPGKTKYDWYGSYYQWGNNYGFANSGFLRYIDSNKVSNPNHTTNPWGPGNFYSSNIFIRQNYSYAWDANSNNNLWGGNVVSNPDSYRQGPCPKGYHIPVKQEMESILNLFNAWKMTNEGEMYCSNNSNCFASRFLLPIQGYRAGSNLDATIVNEGRYVDYWLSSPREYNSNQSYIFNEAGNINNYGSRANGCPVRCFRDTLSKTTIVFESNGGSKILDKQTPRWRETVINLPTPSRNGSRFLGWYTTSGFNEGTRITTNDIESDESLITVYAKWECQLGYSTAEDGMSCLPNMATLNSNFGNEEKIRITYKVPNNTFVNEGYKFIGWNINKDGIGDTYNYDDIITQSGIVLYAQWSKNPWYTYDANGGMFLDGSEEKVVKYEFDYESFEGQKVSHTSNIDDKGNQNGNYDSNLNTNEVITIPGAENLHVVIVYGGESVGCDWLCMRTGSHPEYTATGNYSTSIIGKLGGGNHTNTANLREYDIEGDTVTFAFRTDGSGYGDGYGYYAVIFDSNARKLLFYKTENMVDTPQRTGYTFMGWYETGATESFDFTGTEINQDRVLYAKWKANTYTLSFNTDGGSEIDSIQLNCDTVIPNLPTPTKECNEFSGWDVDLPETMPAHDITLKAIWNYTCSRSSGGGGRKSETTTRDIAIDTNIENEHNSADEKENTETSEENKTTLNDETTHQVISVTQEVPEDGTVEAVVETVKIRNTDIIATVRTEVNPSDSSSSSSSSTTHTKEQKDAYSFAKSNGITTTKSIETAKMDTELTRIQMAKMVSNYAINVLGQEPDTSKGTVEFKDVTEEMDKQYDNAVTKAYQLGIMGQNVNDNKFRPNDEVTRAEFSATLSRLLYNTDEGKYKGTGKYYIPHVAKLYNEGIINKMNPILKEKRGYVMTMLMRTVK